MRSQIGFDLQHAGGFRDARVDLVLRRAAVSQAIGEIVVDRHVRIERIVLEDHGDVAIGRLDIVDDAAADLHLAFGNAFKTGDHAQQRGFAAARGTDKHDEFAVR